MQVQGFKGGIAERYRRYLLADFIQLCSKQIVFVESRSPEIEGLKGLKVGCSHADDMASVSTSGLSGDSDNAEAGLSDLQLDGRFALHSRQSIIALRLQASLEDAGPLRQHCA